MSSVGEDAEQFELMCCWKSKTGNNPNFHQRMKGNMKGKLRDMGTDCAGILYTVCIMRKREKTKEAVYDKTMAQNFPELIKDKTLQIQEAK